MTNDLTLDRWKDLIRRTWGTTPEVPFGTGCDALQLRADPGYPRELVAAHRWVEEHRESLAAGGVVRLRGSRALEVSGGLVVVLYAVFVEREVALPVDVERVVASARAINGQA